MCDLYVKKEACSYHVVCYYYFHEGPKFVLIGEGKLIAILDEKHLNAEKYTAVWQPDSSVLLL